MKIGTLCYVRKGDKTLMLLRNKKERDMHENKWNGLGGKIESGETPEESVIREVFEESGLHIKNPSLKGVLTFPGYNNTPHWYVFVYVATQFEGALLKQSPEGELEWVPNLDLVKLNVWKGDTIFIPWLDQERFFSAKFTYKDGKLIDHNVIFY